MKSRSWDFPCLPFEIFPLPFSLISIDLLPPRAEPGISTSEAGESVRSGSKESWASREKSVVNDEEVEELPEGSS